MIRSISFVGALLCALVLATGAHAGNASLSLNLEFNTLGDLNSGGNWTVVAKSDEDGIAGIVFSFEEGSVNFNPLTGFFHSDIFDVQLSGSFPFMRFEIVEGQSGTPTFDVGVIGGSWPSTYVDDPDLEIFGSNPDLGSFTGGVELATGSFDPGDIPTWYDNGSSGFGANQYVGGSVVAAENVFLTVRHVVPEPATLALFGCGLGGVLLARRRK